MVLRFVPEKAADHRRVAQAHSEDADPANRSYGEHSLMFEMDGEYKEDRRFEIDGKDEKKLRFVYFVIGG